MTTKFISEHKYYWLVVNENAEIKEGDKVESFEEIKTVKQLFIAEETSDGKNIPSVRYEEIDASHQWAEIHCISKLIGYYPKHKDAPELEGVPLMVEMPMVEDVERLASIASKSEGYNGMEEDGGCAAFENGFIEGYKAAQSDKKFSEEDMINACKFGFDKRDKLKESEHIEFDQQDRSESKVYIQSITTTKEQCPIDFKVKMNTTKVPFNKSVEKILNSEPDIINGRLQGEWIFDTPTLINAK